MATASSRKADLNASLKDLSLSGNRKPKFATRSTDPATPPETWEEEAEEASAPSDSIISTPTTSPHASGTSTPHEDHSLPGPPPPTPISPSHRRGKSTDWSAFPAHPAAVTGSSPRSYNVTSPTASRRGTNDMDGKRPEKSTAAAGRMIAGALGVKTPKMGEEQRQYERAVREKERKKKERERAEKGQKEREAEEAKRSVWDE